ncbi:unnamed protein product [Cochlearia groenlandica]
MDGNKDDALKCLQICKTAIEIGDRPRALKFLSKARRLDPNLPIDDLVSKLNNNKPETRKSSGSDSIASDLRKRGGGGGSATSSSSSSSYSQEQISIVRKIKSRKDYYEILDLEKNCSVEDVRKAYRKLSLKVHPDKNHAPGSEEAFKSVSKAFQCLSNGESRRSYDVSGGVGSDQPRRSSSASAAGFNGGGYYYENEFDPNEIFRSFFSGGRGGVGGGGMHPAAAAAQFRSFNFGATRHRNNNHHHHNQGHGDGINGGFFLIFIPIILIILLSLMSTSSQPAYSISATYPYQYKFTTQKGVNYYAKAYNFERDYPRESHKRRVLEEQVERDYVVVLGRNCKYELQRKQWGFVRDTPYCDMMRRFETSEV